jgi:hypothetical protein
MNGGNQKEASTHCSHRLNIAKLQPQLILPGGVSNGQRKQYRTG